MLSEIRKSIFFFSPLYILSLIFFYFNYSNILLGSLYLSYCLIIFIFERKKVNFFFSLIIVFLGLSFLFEFRYPAYFYPVLINLVVTLFFSQSLYKEVSLIEVFALKVEKDSVEIRKYCRNLTKIWAAFMAFLTLLSFFTAVYQDTYLWVIFNGCISYILIFILLAGEYVFRQYYKAKLGRF